MSEPCIITVAITGSVPRKKDTPAVPVTVAEQVESTHEAYEAGASLAHVHVRDENENPSSDPEKFGAFQAGLRKHCPDMIVQFSTGGRGRGADQRGSMLHRKPAMDQPAPGPVTFPNILYANTPQMLAHLAHAIIESGIRPERASYDNT